PGRDGEELEAGAWRGRGLHRGRDRVPPPRRAPARRHPTHSGGVSGASGAGGRVGGGVRPRLRTDRRTNRRAPSGESLTMAATEPLVTALERAPAIVIPLERQANPAILKRRPAPGEWSIHENACHLAEVHPLFFRRLELMLSERTPEIRSYDPGRDDPDDALLKLDLDDCLRRVEADRGRLGARLRGLRPEDWARTARHDEYNSYSVLTMFRHLALHDFHHAYLIEDLMLRRDWPAPARG